MQKTQPIRTNEDLTVFLNCYRERFPNARNQLLITLGLYSALRIGDLLELKWSDLYNFETQKWTDHISLEEKKTGKQKMLPIHPAVAETAKVLFDERLPYPEDYLFSRRTTPKVPICRSTAWRIVKKAADRLEHPGNISCHSMRKTFGYHAWKQGTHPVLLMDIYNHSSFSVTKRYLGIDQDERNAVYMNIKF